MRRELEPLREAVRSWLADGARCGDRKAATLCGNLLEVEPALWTFADVDGGPSAPDWARWLAAVQALDRAAAAPGFHRDDPIAEAPATARTPKLTYGTVLSYPAVDQARAAWDRRHLHLGRLRDLALALGLPDAANRPAILRLPEGFTADRSGEALGTLRKTYPGSHAWAMVDLPDAAAEQRLAEIRLENPDLLANCTMGHPELFGGLGQLYCPRKRRDGLLRFSGSGGRT